MVLLRAILTAQSCNICLDLSRPLHNLGVWYRTATDMGHMGQALREVLQQLEAQSSSATALSDLSGRIVYHLC